MVVVDMLLELVLCFVILGADLARVTSVLFDPDPLGTIASAVFQVQLGVPRPLELLVALWTLLVLGCVQQRILLALLSQHFTEFPGRVRVIGFF